MKENVIIGKLIPAGTGLRRYRNVKLNTDVDLDSTLDFVDDFEFDTAVSDTDATLDLDADLETDFADEASEGSLVIQEEPVGAIE